MISVYKIASVVCDDCGHSHEGVTGEGTKSNAAMTKLAKAAAKQDGFLKAGGMWFCPSCNPATPSRHR